MLHPVICRSIDSKFMDVLFPRLDAGQEFTGKTIPAFLFEQQPIELLGHRQKLSGPGMDIYGLSAPMLSDLSIGHQVLLPLRLSLLGAADCAHHLCRDFHCTDLLSAHLGGMGHMSGGSRGIVGISW